MGFTLAGEALQRLLPISIPASVYGLVLLFAALCTGLIKVSQIREVGGFLTSILPVLFVSPSVGIAENWPLIKPQLLPLLLLLVATTLLTFGIAGRVTQGLLKKGGAENE